MPEGPLSRDSDAATGRKFGEAPLLGKVPRSPDSAVGRGGSGSVVRRRKKYGMRVRAWTGLLLLVSLSAILFIVVAYVREKSKSSDDSSEPLRASRILESAFAVSAQSELPSLSESDALKIVEAALSNREAARVRDFFILGENSDLQAALDALMSITRKEGNVSGTRWLGEKFADGRILAEVVASMGDEKSNRLAQLTVGADGKWRIDLDSYLRVVSPDWETILSGATETSIVRVFLAHDTYYNGIYADDTNWKAYTLASADVPDLLYAYVQRGSRQARALDKILSVPETIHRATLEIRKSPESGKRQFEIARVIAGNWVVSGADFDKDF